MRNLTEPAEELLSSGSRSDGRSDRDINIIVPMAASYQRPDTHNDILEL
jgi:hypothetical protein